MVQHSDMMDALRFAKTISGTKTYIVFAFYKTHLYVILGWIPEQTLLFCQVKDA